MKEHWQADKELARAILADRGMRRRMLAAGLVIALAMVVLGLWVIPGWLEQEWWRFALWWGGCGLVTVWLLLFALYDALVSLREGRK